MPTHPGKSMADTQVNEANISQSTAGNGGGAREAARLISNLRDDGKSMEQIARALGVNMEDLQAIMSGDVEAPEGMVAALMEMGAENKA